MKKALSLIEVCVSIVIVSIVLVSMLGIFSQGYWYLRKSRIKVAAYNLGRGITEIYSDWNTLDALDGTANGTVTNGTYTNPPDNVTLNNITYTPSLAIFDGPGPDPNILKRLNITISWDGVAKNFTVTTLKANY